MICYENARWLISAIARGLEARQGEGVQEVLSRLSEQDVSEAAFRELEPRGLSVLPISPMHR